MSQIHKSNSNDPSIKDTSIKDTSIKDTMMNGKSLQNGVVFSSGFVSVWNAYERRVFLMDLFKALYSCLGILSTFLGFFVFLGIYWLATALGIQSLEMQIFFAVAVFAALLFLPSLYFFSFRCPRCHQRFFVSSAGREPDRKSCCHCDLPIYGDPFPSDPAQ